MQSRDNRTLRGIADCVLMLTWSDWKTEPRSNRYHYALRLAQHLPVLFVQPDAPDGILDVEESGTPGIRIVHVPERYDERQATLIATALNDSGYRRPLLWVYNPLFYKFIGGCFSPLKVYHATEDYFALDNHAAGVTRSTLRWVIARVDLLIAVSETVLDHYRDRGGFAGEALVLPNGCDFSFWTAHDTTRAPAKIGDHKPVALYQGGINRRLNWDLLEALLTNLPDWDFWFCGRVASPTPPQWKRLLKFRNARYLGELTPEEIRSLFEDVTVGIIPFVESEEIQASLPLKAFEYVAGGLPVVSVPITALRTYPDLFLIASGTEAFSEAVRFAATTRHNCTLLDMRRRAALTQSYDRRFSEFLEWTAAFRAKPAPTRGPCNALVLYDVRSVHVNTVREHLQSFNSFSRHRVFYAAATGEDTPAADLSPFDVVIIHYCVRVNLDDHLSPAYVRALRAFRGLKLLFIQDEYDTTETARLAIERLGIQVVYTCVPKEYIPKVYPPDRFATIDFIPTLTGFAPATVRRSDKPLRERPYLIAYRGRSLPYWYGDLGQEKRLIGERMKEACSARGLNVDIEWDDSKRVYGKGWYDFLQSAKATLGTESGSNVFDDHGDLRRSVEAALRCAPETPYSVLRPTLIAAHEGSIRMNQISPKIFEAIACRTALVLFEGTYSGVVEPNVHFIPLKKDFSNVDEVLAKLQNDDLLENMTERAWQDVIGSGRYSYQAFVNAVDADIERRVRIPIGRPLFAVLCAPDEQPGTRPAERQTLPIPTSSPQAQNEWKMVQTFLADLEAGGDRSWAEVLTDTESRVARPSATEQLHHEVSTSDVARWAWLKLPRGLRTVLRPIALRVLHRQT